MSSESEPEFADALGLSGVGEALAAVYKQYVSSGQFACRQGQTLAMLPGAPEVEDCKNAVSKRPYDALQTITHTSCIR